MVCIDDQTGQQYYNGQGYSGTKDGRNNPDAQDEENIGVIPEGSWQLEGNWYNDPSRVGHKGLGRNVMRLRPLPGNECLKAKKRACNTFRIHGNNQANDASEGCIVLPPDRTRIHLNETINVVP